MNRFGAGPRKMTGTASTLTLVERLRALVRGRRSPEVLVIVNTVQGPRAVPMALEDVDR